MQMNESRRWLVVAAYAAAMAWVESAVVYYLRTMIDRIIPYQPNPLPIIGYLGPVELGREAATMVMLLTVGILAGKTWRARFGYAAIAFGVWDICYYLFLKLMCGWPRSFFDWDILFLLPLPWWGPVLAPMCIALLMICWGTLATQVDRPSAGGWRPWTFWGWNFLGVAISLKLFMADTMRVAGQGLDAIRNVLPVHFSWHLFSAALVLMAVPIIENLFWIWRSKSSATPTLTSEAQNEKLAQIF
jgi:hypothetical protein